MVSWSGDCVYFFFSSRRRHTRSLCDWSSDVCSSDLAIAVTGDAVGPTLFYGAGAGELPTASAVVADLIEIAREIRRGSSGRVAPLSYLPESLEPRPLVPLGEIHASCYLRFTAQDRPG